MCFAIQSMRPDHDDDDDDGDEKETVMKSGIGFRSGHSSLGDHFFPSSDVTSFSTACCHRELDVSATRI